MNSLLLLGTRDMEHDISVNLHMDNEGIRALIKGLQGILDKKGKDILIPYGHPNIKTGKSYKYMKSGYELAMYQVKTTNDCIITFFNTDSGK
jgi:hypothetical protein